MKKAHYTLILMFFASQSLFAQWFSAGPRLGGNFVTMTNLLDNGQSRTFPFTLSTGISVRLRLEDIYIVAEVNYEQKGYNVKLASGDQSYERRRNNYIEFPVLFRFNPVSTVDFDIYTEAGVYVAYWLSSSLEINDTLGGRGNYVNTSTNPDITRTDTQILYNLWDVGPVLGAGISHYFSGGASEVYAGFRINYGLLDAMRYTGPNASSRASGSNNLVINLSIGYYFDNFDKMKKVRFRHGPYY